MANIISDIKFNLNRIPIDKPREDTVPDVAPVPASSATQDGQWLKMASQMRLQSGVPSGTTPSLLPDTLSNEQRSQLETMRQQMGDEKFQEMLRHGQIMAAAAWLQAGVTPQTLLAAGVPKDILETLGVKKEDLPASTTPSLPIQQHLQQNMFQQRNSSSEQNPGRSPSDTADADGINPTAAFQRPEGRRLMASTAEGSLPRVSQATPVQQSFNNALAHYQTATQGTALPVDGLTQVQSVMLYGVSGLQTQLQYFSQQVQRGADVSRSLQTDIQQLNTAIREWPDGVDRQSFSYTAYDGYGRPYPQENVSLTKKEAQDLAQNLQNQLTTNQGLTQLQTLQLQNMTQAYNEAFSTMSAISKAAFTTAQNTIHNIA